MQVDKFIRDFNYARTKGINEIDRLLGSLDKNNLIANINGCHNSRKLSTLIETITEAFPLIEGTKYKPLLNNILTRAKAVRRNLIPTAPIGVNTLKALDSQAVIEHIFIEITPYTGEKFGYKFKCSDSLKDVMQIVYSASFPLLKRVHESGSKTEINPENLTFIIHARDFPGEEVDSDFEGIDFSSMGLPLAVGIYFNYLLYCASGKKEKLKQMRRIFEQELESVAFTGEINDNEEISHISGIEQKVKVAAYMGMKRVFCPTTNHSDAMKVIEKIRNEGKTDLPAIIPVETLEQAIALVRYGQHLEKAAEKKLRPFVESGFAVLTDKHLREHFLSDVTFSQVINRQQEMLGIGVNQTDDRFSERETFIPNQTKAKVLDDFLNRGIIITGDGGIGKTIFLLHLFQEYAEKIINGTEIKEFKGQLKIPIYVELNKYMISKKLNLVFLIKESIGNDLTVKDIEGELENGRFILLLDGVNEIVANKRKLFFDERKSISQENLFIITSRGNTPIDIHGFQRLEIEKFNDEKIEKYINDRLESQPEKANILKKILTEKHSDLARNPFFLSLIVDYAQEKDLSEINENTFRNRGKLLDWIVYKRYKLKSDKTETIADEDKISLFKEIMPGLARHLFFEEDKIFFNRSDICKYAEKAKKKTKVKQFLRILNNPNLSHIIRHFYGDMDNRHWKFTHDIFFEYFAAVALQTEFLRLMAETGQMPRPELADYLQEYINKKKWEDIVFIAVGLLEDCNIESSGCIDKFGNISCECKEDGFFCKKKPEELAQYECSRTEEIKKFQLTSEILSPRK